jgi:hypothetical protein
MRKRMHPPVQSVVLRGHSSDCGDPQDSETQPVVPGSEPVILPMRLFQRGDPPEPEPGTPGNEKEVRSKEHRAGSIDIQRAARAAA